MGRDGVHQEPGAVAGGRDRRSVFRAGGGAGAGEGVAFGRTLHGGRDAGASLGGAEEFSSEEGEGGEAAGSPGGSGESDGGFSRGKAQQRNARLQDGPGGAAVQEECGERSEVELPGACAGGESQRAGGGDARESGDGHGRARSGARDDRSADGRAAARDAGRRQRI